MTATGREHFWESASVVDLATVRAARRAAGIRIRQATLADIPKLVEIHREGMPDDFMVRLGSVFQRKVLFPAMIQSEDTCVYVAEHRFGVGGFLITREGYGGVVTQLLSSRPVWFPVSCLHGALTHPSILPQMWGVLAQLKSRNAEPEDCASAELFLMAVAKWARREGLGQALVQHSARQLRTRGARTYRVLFHSMNVPADRLYEHTGFTKERVLCFAGQTWRQREMDLRGTSGTAVVGEGMGRDSEGGSVPSEREACAHRKVTA
ncbi:MAG: GNAT family N-acetyltransferase [bacterium]|nr:GNAT family N-acetyltransferase [bacterium]